MRGESSLRLCERPVLLPGIGDWIQSQCLDLFRIQTLKISAVLAASGPVVNASARAF